MGLILGIILVCIPLMFGVYYIAERNGRDAVVWLLLSLFISPIVCIIILLCLSETEEKRERRIVDEELLRQRVREGTYIKQGYYEQERDERLQRKYEEQKQELDKAKRVQKKIGIILFLVFVIILLVIIFST